MQQQHDTFTIKLGDAIVQMPARTVVQTYLKSILNADEQPAQQTHPIPRIGEYWSGQGGIYAGLMRGENGSPDYHLIVPAGADASIESITWGGRGKEESGAQSEYDGAANTVALIASKHSHPAAEWAAKLDIDGFTDFYLPSRRELRLCWVNVPELFETGWHWSSTQYSAFTAWFQYFDDGYQGFSDKDDALRARAVRRFIGNSLI